MQRIDFNRLSTSIFLKTLAKPKLTIALGGLFILLSAIGMLRLVQDTSVDSFIPKSHPSVEASDRAEEIFGLRDPVVIAVITTEENQAYSPQALTVLQEIQQKLQSIDNIRDDRVMSVLTESSIRGTEDELFVDLIGGEGLIDEAYSERVKALVAAMPPYIGTLVSEDGSSALVIAELHDQSIANDTYDELMEIVASVDPRGFEINVAGQAAVAGYLSKYIDKDSRKLMPAVFALVLAVLFIAFFRLKALAGPLLVITASALGSVGIMAWFGVPYFAITSALPIVVLSIAVADSIHVLTAYYELRERKPELSYHEVTLAAMIDMWTPVTLTTLTTAAGFIGLAAASIMPPLAYFGIFAALGVVIAWGFTMLVLPPVILLMKLDSSPMFKLRGSKQAGYLGQGLVSIAKFSARYPLVTLASSIVVLIIALNSAMSLRVDRNQVDNFKPDESIRTADKVINEKFSGTSYLDVIIDTDGEEGIFVGNRMQRVADLQRHMETLPFLTKTVSIVDYVSLLHHAVTLDGKTEVVVPSDGNAIAQYLFLYESSADPTDFEEEVDQAYQTLLLRGFVNSGIFSEQRAAVEQLERYLLSEFNGEGMTGTLSGRVNIDYHWMKNLSDSHFISVGISLLLVWIVSGLLFRSAIIGLVTLAPVVFTIIGIYAIMAEMGIYLEPATSMFAAISIGIGVDFSIHLIDRLQLGFKEGYKTVAEVIDAKFPHATRACCFNVIALGTGFNVLLLSELPTLQRFGGLVAFASVSSFASAVIIIPMAWGLREKFFSTRSIPIKFEEAVE